MRARALRGGAHGRRRRRRGGEPRAERPQGPRGPPRDAGVRVRRPRGVGIRREKARPRRRRLRGGRRLLLPAPRLRGARGRVHRDQGDVRQVPLLPRLPLPLRLPAPLRPLRRRRPRPLPRERAPHLQGVPRQRRPALQGARPAGARARAPRVPEGGVRRGRRPRRGAPGGGAGVPCGARRGGGGAHQQRQVHRRGARCLAWVSFIHSPWLSAQPPPGASKPHLSRPALPFPETQALEALEQLLVAGASPRRSLVRRAQEAPPFDLSVPHCARTSLCPRPAL